MQEGGGAFGSKQTCQQSSFPTEREVLADKAGDTEEGESCPLPEPICPHPLVLLSPGWGTEQVHAMISVPTVLNSTHAVIIAPRSAVGGQGRKRRWNLGLLLRRRAWSELTALLPTHGIASINHPLLASGASHGLFPGDRPLFPASPRHAQLPRGTNATWLFVYTRSCSEAQFLPSPKHFLASSSLAGGQGTTLASDPPCSLPQEPPSDVGEQCPSLHQVLYFLSL